MSARRIVQIILSAWTLHSSAVHAQSVARLAWIQGAWVGHGAEQPFFECYRIVGDSSIYVMTFKDSLFTTVEDTTRFVVRNGQLDNWDAPARWAASEIGQRSVAFRPIAAARNTFTWQFETPDSRTAHLSWPARGNAGCASTRLAGASQLTRVPRVPSDR
jgi:hypothetical protein